MDELPSIGVFDSGFGGLTVLKALLELIPDANYLYFGDTARLPYGSKSAETVAKYAVEAARFLNQQGTQMLVVACNTATALALGKISQAVSIPVIGVVEPGAQRAAAASQNRKAVVIGTEATISSRAYLKALQNLGVEAREKACPLLVPLVEEGWIEHPVTEQIARIYMGEAFADGFESAEVLRHRLSGKISELGRAFPGSPDPQRPAHRPKRIVGPPTTKVSQTVNFRDNLSAQFSGSLYFRVE